MSKEKKCIFNDGKRITRCAQKLNLVASQVLRQQMSKYEKEKKRLQREILNLRKTRDTLDAGIKLIVPLRARSHSEPQQSLTDQLRRDSSFSSHLNQRPPLIVAKSPIPLRKAATTEVRR